jgi:hypothetical protein
MNRIPDLSHPLFSNREADCGLALSLYCVCRMECHGIIGSHYSE